jgi:hypothetical protein
MGLKCGAIKSILGNILGISFKQLWEHIEKITRPFLLHIKHFIWPHENYGESISFWT